jgi:hypothetical protein
MVLEYHRHGTKQTPDAVLQTVVHLLRDFRKRKNEIVALKGDTPNSISLRPDAAVTANDALA